MTPGISLRTVRWVAVVTFVTIIGAVVGSNAVTGNKEPSDKRKNQEITISMLKPTELSADKAVAIRVTVVNKSSHEIEGNGTIVLRHSATGETLVQHLPGLLKQKTLIREVSMKDAPDQCTSCFTANDVHGHWFRSYSPDSQFLSIAIELRD